MTANLQHNIKKYSGKFFDTIIPLLPVLILPEYVDTEEIS